MKKVFSCLLVALIIAVSTAGCSQRETMQAWPERPKTAQPGRQVSDTALAGYNCMRVEMYTGNEICP